MDLHRIKHGRAAQLHRWGRGVCRELGLGLLDLCFPATCVLCCGPHEAASVEETGWCVGSADRPGGPATLCSGCRGVLEGAVIERGCWGCGRRLTSGTLPRATDAAQCGLGRAAEDAEDSDGNVPRCFPCRRDPPPLTRTIALGGYQDVLREAVIASKSPSFSPLAMALGRLLAIRLEELLGRTPLDVVTYIPSHWTRRCGRRGVPTQLMAIEVGRRLRLPVRPLLRAVRRTRKQGTLTDLERHANVRGAFALKARYAQSGRRVLVVDDVWTTGSTLREAARVLRAATASDVYAAVVARAVGQHDS